MNFIAIAIGSGFVLIAAAATVCTIVINGLAAIHIDE